MQRTSSRAYILFSLSLSLCVVFSPPLTTLNRIPFLMKFFRTLPFLTEVLILVEIITLLLFFFLVIAPFLVFFIALLSAAFLRLFVCLVAALLPPPHLFSARVCVFPFSFFFLHFFSPASD